MAVEAVEMVDGLVGSVGARATIPRYQSTRQSRGRGTVQHVGRLLEHAQLEQRTDSSELELDAHHRRSGQLVEGTENRFGLHGPEGDEHGGRRVVGANQRHGQAAPVGRGHRLAALAGEAGADAGSRRSAPDRHHLTEDAFELRRHLVGRLEAILRRRRPSPAR